MNYSGYRLQSGRLNSAWNIADEVARPNDEGLSADCHEMGTADGGAEKREGPCVIWPVDLEKVP